MHSGSDLITYQIAFFTEPGKWKFCWHSTIGQSWDWRLYPTTCLGGQVQGEHLPFAHCSVQGHPSSALHCWHWWRCGLHRWGCYLHQFNCAPLSGPSFRGCFNLPNLFFSGWVYGLACQGFFPRKKKVGAQLHAPVMIGLAVSYAELLFCL